MSPRNSTPLRQSLKRLISKKEALNLARTSLFVKRVRKLDLSTFLWTLIFSFGSGGPRNYSVFFENYLRLAKKPISESAFYEWLGKPGFPVWTRNLVVHLMDELAKTNDFKMSGILAQFKELFVTDSSVIKLANRLSKRYPAAAPHSSPAAIKVHVIQKGGGRNLHRITLTEGKRNDSRVLKMGPWVHNSLILMDLGYYCFSRFSRIEKLGGYFVSRVKSGANPIILRVLRSHQGRAISVTGEKLQDVIYRLKRNVIDLEVEVAFKGRSYRGKRKGKTSSIRLVGIWFEGEKRYRLFFTNLSPQKASAKEVADLYRLRWQVELFFKELKSVYKLDRLPGERKETIEAMVYLSIASALVSRSLLRDLKKRHNLAEAGITDGQGSKIVQRHALALLDIVLCPVSEISSKDRKLEKVLCTTVKRRTKRRANLKRELEDLRGCPEQQRQAA